MQLRRIMARAAEAGVGLSLAVALGACGGLDPVATYDQVTDPAKLYLTITLDHRAINLSTVTPYDTLQLTATPRNALGEPLVGLPAPTFSLVNASDSTRLTVTPDGLLKALQSGSNIKVIADLAIAGNTRHTDTAYVNVKTTAPPQVASLSFDPVPPDSAVRSVPQILTGMTAEIGLLNALFALKIYNANITGPTVLDAMGNKVTGLLIEYRSLDPSIATIPDQNHLTSGAPKFLGVHPGQVGIVATTTAYGITVADTVPFTLTWPGFQFVDVTLGSNDVPRFKPNDIRIAPYGIVLWQSHVGDSVDVTFDDPTNVIQPPAVICTAINAKPATYGSGPACGTGDFLVPAAPLDTLAKPLPAMTTRIRQFPVPGVYTYHSTRTGATGRIVVTNDPDPAALP